MKLTRVFLLGTAVSLTLAAAIGIYAFLFGQFGDLESKLITTTLSIGLFSITALGTAIVYERGRWRPVMLVAFMVSGFGLLFYLYVIWLHEYVVGRSYYYSSEITQTMLLTAVWAFALPHMGLLGLAPRSAELLRWTRLLSIVFVFILAGLISAMAIIEPAGRDEEIWLRAIGVFAILAGLGTLVTPILVRVQHIDRTTSTESTALSLSLTCPRCLTTQTLDSGHARCGHCRLKFHIEIEEPRCPKCNYLLHMLTEPVCPECGQPLSAEELATSAPPPTSPDPTTGHTASVDPSSPSEVGDR